jgi:hypothetical protein
MSWLSAMRRPRGGWNLSLVFAAACLVGGGVRAWQLHGRPPQGWNDSQDYLTSAQAPWFSLDLWAGPRTPAVPALFKLAGYDGQRVMELQVLVATICWATLAVAVASVLVPGWRRWVGAGLIVALSLSSRVTMWDQQLLSETLALAFTALVAAAALWLSRRVTLGRAAALVGASVLWVAVRDAPAVALLAAAFALAVVALVTRSVRRDILAVTAAGISVVALLTMSAANHGGRDDQPVQHVFAVRILPYPDRIEWFADHGMPMADEIVALGPPIYPVPGGPPLVGVPEQPPFDEWHRWVGSSGRGAFLLFLATHPDYVVTEPLREPERAYNNAEGDLEFYRAIDFRHVPLIGAFAAPTVWVLPVGLVIVAGLVWYDRLRSRLVLCGMVVAATAVPHGVMAWHSDGMETARHLVVPGMQLRIGVLLLAAALLGERAVDTTDAEAEADGVGVPTPATGDAGQNGHSSEESPAPIDQDGNEASRTGTLDTTEA